MPWQNTPESRRRNQETYGSPEFIAARKLARKRADGRCEQCGHRHRTQCDHVIPVSQGGTHDLANLKMLCAGDRSCKCHERKTAAEGGGFRSKRKPNPDPVSRTQW
jgi:HNH endonuclease